MRRWTRGSAWLLWAVLASACGHRSLDATQGPRASMVSVAERGLRRARREPNGPLVLVSMGEADVVGIDPQTGERLWRRPLRPFGRPAAYGRLVVIPVRGHRIAALDADTGALRWESALPGQALTGATVSERWVMVTALSKRPGARSVVAMLAANDGRIRWQRQSSELMGVPAAAGRYGFVPHSGNVVALSLPTGRLLSTMRPAQSLPLQSVVRQHGAVYATSGDALVDLYGGPDAIYRIRSRQFSAFAQVDGLEPGLGHEDGLTLQLLSTAAGAPRRALFLGRRVVIGLRFDQFGRPAEARWVHLPYDQREYVTMHAEGDRVWLVESTGALTVLDSHTGRTRRRTDGELAPRGALFVGGEPPADAPQARGSARRDDTVATLVSLIEEPDARLLPAQQLAVDLLWRHESPQVRTLVRQLSARAIRPREGPESERLRGQARALLDTPWGPSSRSTLAALLERLASAARLDEEGWKEVRREVLSAGSPRVLHRVMSLLDDPAVTGSGLSEIARTARDLGDSRAVAPVKAFVLKYHVDPEVVSESKAMFYALEFLLDQGLPPDPSRVDPAQSQVARDALQQVLDNEFTVPMVRKYIEDRLPSLPSG